MERRDFNKERYAAGFTIDFGPGRKKKILEVLPKIQLYSFEFFLPQFEILCFFQLFLLKIS